MDNPLDNPAWHALVGPHANLALSPGAARNYPRDMARFSALAEQTAAAYADLAVDLPPGMEARLFRPVDEPTPAGWETLSAKPIRQMVMETDDLPGSHPAEATAVLLGPADAADMLALAEIAKPGPFYARTGDLGRYAGVRGNDGRLVAMAGERFRFSGYVELSAICVHPNARGQGLGVALTLHLAREALARGETPFLHVFPDNPAAALYGRFGFRDRATLWVLWRRPIAAESAA